MAVPWVTSGCVGLETVPFDRDHPFDHWVQQDKTENAISRDTLPAIRMLR